MAFEIEKAKASRSTCRSVSSKFDILVLLVPGILNDFYI